MYKALDIDREKLTILGVIFSDIHSLEKTANAIGSNMFEGFEPTPELIQLYVDWKNNGISEKDFIYRLSTFCGK
jgi:hypothetical protein